MRKVCSNTWAADAKACVHIAAPQPGIEGEVGALSSLEVLEVGKASGRPQLVVDGDRRGHRLDLVVDRGQLLIFGDDLLRPLPRRCGDRAASTTATGSPTKRTLSIARIGWSWNAGP